MFLFVFVFVERLQLAGSLHWNFLINDNYFFLFFFGFSFLQCFYIHNHIIIIYTFLSFFFSLLPFLCFYHLIYALEQVHVSVMCDFIIQYWLHYLSERWESYWKILDAICLLFYFFKWCVRSLFLRVFECEWFSGYKIVALFYSVFVSLKLSFV